MRHPRTVCVIALVDTARLMFLGAMCFGFQAIAAGQTYFNEEETKFADEVRTLLLDRTYAELDALSDRLRRERPVFTGGRFHLAEFYESLSQRSGTTTQERKRSARDRVEQLEGWTKATKSPTAHIAQAAAISGLASEERGGEYASRVFPAAMAAYFTPACSRQTPSRRRPRNSRKQPRCAIRNFTPPGCHWASD